MQRNGETKQRIVCIGMSSAAHLACRELAPCVAGDAAIPPALASEIIKAAVAARGEGALGVPAK